MADTHEVMRILEESRRTNVNLEKLVKGFREGTFNVKQVTKQGLDAAARLARPYEGFGFIGDTLHRVENIFNEFGRKVENVIGVFTFVGIEESLKKFSGSLTQNYRELNAVGQTFNGSILNMQIAASDAELPLDQFKNAIVRNSAVIARVGVQPYFQMQTALRRNIENFGMLGLTLDQVDEYMGEFLETQRLYGRLENLDREQARSSIQNLAVETSALAGITGKNRQQMMKDMQQAMRDNSLRLRMMIEGERMTERERTSLNSAMAMFASMQGEAGQVMSRFLAQSFGKGSAMFAEDAQQFFEAGAGSLVNSMETLNQMIQGGATEDAIANYMGRMKAEMDALSPVLRLQAQAGNRAAESVIAVTTNFQRLDAQQLAQARTNAAARDTWTRLMSNLEQLFSTMFGRIRNAFFTSFGRMTEFLNRGSVQRAFERLGDQLASLAGKFGSWLADLFSTDNEAAVDRFVGTLVEGATNIAAGVMALIDGLANVPWAALAAITKVVAAGFRGIATITGFVYDKLSGVNEVFASIVAAGTGLALFMGGRMLFQSLMGGTQRGLSYMARRVSDTFERAINAVLQRHLGGGLGGGGGPGAGPGGGRGWRARLGGMFRGRGGLIAGLAAVVGPELLGMMSQANAAEIAHDAVDAAGDKAGDVMNGIVEGTATATANAMPSPEVAQQQAAMAAERAQTTGGLGDYTHAIFSGLARGFVSGAGVVGDMASGIEWLTGQAGSALGIGGSDAMIEHAKRSYAGLENTWNTARIDRFLDEHDMLTYKGESQGAQMAGSMAGLAGSFVVPVPGLGQLAGASKVARLGIHAAEVGANLMAPSVDEEALRQNQAEKSNKTNELLGQILDNQKDSASRQEARDAVRINQNEETNRALNSTNWYLGAQTP